MPSLVQEEERDLRASRRGACSASRNLDILNDATEMIQVEHKESETQTEHEFAEHPVLVDQSVQVYPILIFNR